MPVQLKYIHNCGLDAKRVQQLTIVFSQASMPKRTGAGVKNYRS
jgi:hypothetical protein